MDSMLRNWKLAALALLLAGCDQATNSPAPPTGAGNLGATPAVSVGDTSRPERAVKEFMDAVRNGDDAKAEALLTPLARKKTAERNISVQPPGSPSATYKIGEVEAVGDDGAHVTSQWTDVDAQGNAHTDEIIWVLRKESEGWRLAGMATRVFDDGTPLVLNFEDPDDMIRKRQWVEEEAARRANAEQRQAQRPANQVPAPPR